MARTLTAAFTTQLDGEIFRWALLTFFDVKDNALRFWTGYGDLTYDSNTYTGAGDLINISGVEEATDTRAVKVTAAISGIPSANISLVFNETWRRRAAKIWLATFDSSDPPALVADPALIFSGRMDTLTIVEGPETSTISVDIESRLIDLNRTRERRYTHEDQIDRFPGDVFFDGIAESVNREIPWSRKGNAVNSTTNPVVPPFADDDF